MKANNKSKTHFSNNNSNNNKIHVLKNLRNQLLNIKI